MPDESVLRERLSDWSLPLGVPLAALNGLLHLLHDFHPSLPLDARTVLSTPKLSNSIQTITLAFTVGCRKFLDDGILDPALRASEHTLLNQSMHGSAMQCYGRLRFPIGTCDFWTPATP
jgi:hypothetical protein